MDIKDIYKTIFPIGGVDNNNRYIDMAAKDINVVQLLEPAVSVSELVIPPHKRTIKEAIPERMAFRIPVISINNSLIDTRMLTNFQLDYSGFIPSVMVEFIDLNNEMLSTNALKDGSIIKVYVGGNGDELYYKPIRQDFVITEIQKLNSGAQNHGDWIQYRVRGTLNVPMGHRKESWSGSKSKSDALQVLFNLAIYTGLGFATNFTEKTIGEMKWINTLGRSYFDFMKDIADHTCYSPNTFFTAFIDQYYNLNFVECHRLLSHGGSKTDTPAMIYASYQQTEEPNVDKENGRNKITEDQITVENDRPTKQNPTQRVSYYFITNFHFFKGWSNYIDSYIEISDGYAAMDEGYKKHLTYSDSNGGSWGKNIEFVIPPIDNLKRNDATQEIEPISDEPSQDSYVPLNLVHTNSPEYTNDNISEIDKIAAVESYVNYGEVDTSNMFKQYYFAEVQNSYQMRCMKKCGLRVTLSNYNPAIIKFSRIWVDLYDMNIKSSDDIKPRGEYDNTAYGKFIEEKDKNIIYYPDEGVDERSGTNINFPRGNYNRSLSGWYVVTEMKIYYDYSSKNLKMALVLNRIERRPLYKKEYEVARDAIKKYKEDNLPTDIFKNVTDTSY